MDDTIGYFFVGVLALLPWIIGTIFIISLFFTIRKLVSKNPADKKNAKLIIKIFVIVFLLITGWSVFSAFSFDRASNKTFDQNIFPIYSTGPTYIGDNTLREDQNVSPPFIKFRWNTPKGEIIIRQIKENTTISRLFVPPVCNLNSLSNHVAHGGNRKNWPSDPTDTCNVLYSENDRSLYVDNDMKLGDIGPAYVGKIQDTYILFYADTVERLFDGTNAEAEPYVLDFMKNARQLDRSEITI